MKAILKLIEGDKVTSQIFEEEKFFIHTRDGDDLWSLRKGKLSDDPHYCEVFIFFNKTVFHSVEFIDDDTSIKRTIC